MLRKLEAEVLELPVAKQVIFANFQTLKMDALNQTNSLFIGMHLL